MSVKRITVDSIFLSLLIISAFISIPVSDISFTLQVLVVLTISMLLPTGDALIIIGLYFLMGIMGIPVFSQGGGFAYFLKPSFGYLLGFLLVPFVMWPFKKLKINNILKDSISSLLSLFVIYLLGTIYFIFVMKTVNGIDYSFIKVLSICVIPFIIFDLLKIVGSVLISVSLRKIIKFETKEEIEKNKSKRRTLIKNRKK